MKAIKDLWAGLVALLRPLAKRGAVGSALQVLAALLILFGIWLVAGLGIAAIVAGALLFVTGVLYEAGRL